MIVAEDLSRGFGPERARLRALDRLSLVVPAGCVTGVLGPNGAGKTTLFRLLAGLIRSDGGRASIMGYDVAERPREARSRLGLMTEEPGLPERLTPSWHVALHGSLHGLPRAVAVERARSLLRDLGIEGSIDLPHARLSKGTRQKVALARALVHDPPALILDEPTAGLDLETADWMRGRIRAAAGRGCAVLMSTHQPVEAERVCDAIAIVARGRLLASGAIGDLLQTDVTLEQVYRRVVSEER